MNIRVKTTKTYMSDRGDEFILQDMEASHLINEIKHHSDQVEGLENTLADLGKHMSEQYIENIRKRIANLKITINVLMDELASRDPDKDEDREE